MASRKCLLLFSVALASAAPAFAGTATAAPWVRGYTVANHEPAWYFGGRPEYRKAGLIQPGSDCVQGNIDPEPDLDYKAIFTTSWRTPHEVENLVNPPGYDTVKDYLSLKHALQEHEMTYRGFRKGINSYMNPFTAPDPGMYQVTGKIAEGFNLDGNVKTGGFTSPSGERGIDNAAYRAWGCIPAFRGQPYSAALSMRANDKMLDGLYTMVIRISGNQDPMNDSDATLEIGYSPEHVVRDANGVASDYSFRLVKSSQYTKMKATIKNGVVETAMAPELHAPNFSWNRGVSRDADYRKGRVRLVIDADGNASGLVGGYRDWRDVYFENVEAQGGATSETVYHQNSLAMYYSLKRNADAAPDPKTGRNTRISIAYRFLAVPAFVVDPAKPVDVTVLEPDKREIGIYNRGRGLFFKGITTRQVVGMPYGSPDTHNVDRLILKLPNAGEMKLQINQPPFVGPKEAPRAARPGADPDKAEDAKPVQPSPAKKPADGQQQVNKDAPTTVASAASGD